MDVQRIEEALRQATDTEIIEIGPDAIDRVADVFRRAFPNVEQTACIIADETTYEIAGARTAELLTAAGVVCEDPFVFPAQPAVYADYKTVEKAAAHLKQSNAIPIAVGSGTLNDIVKLGSHLADRRYLVVATAASMDGYTAFGASISKEGYKQTFSCPAPIAVVADVSVIARAPRAMTASGYADLLGKVTAGADWIIADALGVEPIDRRAWDLVQPSLRAWTARPKAIANGDLDAIEELIEGLILTGLAMQANKNSRPASGSEHQFSHLWEMSHIGKEGLWLSHGFKVGVGTIASAALYQEILKHDLATIDVEEIIRMRVSREELATQIEASHDIPILKEKGVEESLAKFAEPNVLRERIEILSRQWSSLKTELESQLMDPETIRSALRAAGCPVSPESIGLSLGDLHRSYAGAQHIRRRYTMLDTAMECGIFDASVAKLFDADGFWGATA